ncbi:hypothetical protein ACFY15_02455 [Streptomyces sp. NPDC001373]|uniref:hypothetical protein n=1 Tax=Streptomyces sp. NPDC001373 TaxID=3364565 RepID=UPI00369C6A34
MTMKPERVTVQAGAIGHLMRWLTAVELQAERVCAPPPFANPVGDTPPASGAGLAQEADALLFASALRDFLRAADLIKWTVDGTVATSPVDKALHSFELAVPNLKDIRDVLEHFDAYEKGQGDFQKAAVKGGQDVWTSRMLVDPRDGSPLLFLMPGDGQKWTLDVRTSTVAAQVLYASIQKALLDHPMG